MNILALDSADQVLSVALATNTGLWYTEMDAGSRHSELLMECVDWLCKTSGLHPSDLNLVACMKGPGSFTGLRIAYSAAKGLCLALGIPLAAYSTLDCLAYPLSIWPGIVLPAIDAKKSRFFAAFYRGTERISDYLDACPETLAKTAKTCLLPNESIVITGSGANILHSCFTNLVSPDLIKIHPQFKRGMARELLDLTKGSIINGVNDINSGPVYLRKSDAELNMAQDR
jgi:tRNA threonylcarbamoyladenosine biosynthesis protein TsaB